MHLKNLTVTMVAAMALAATSSAFAVILCLPTSNNGAGEVQLPVTITAGLAANATFNTTGPVTVNINDCTTGATSCTIIAQGTPADPGVQIATLEFTEVGDPTPSECGITKADGLPVEMSKFSVE